MRQRQLDVLINNAGFFRASEPVTQDCLDVRFVVNTIAPYLLAQRLLPPDEDRERYAFAEEEARTKGAGLWSGPKSCSPWEWRKRQRLELPITKQPDGRA